jgi:hypothetical protein
MRPSSSRESGFPRNVEKIIYIPSRRYEARRPDGPESLGSSGHQMRPSTSLTSYMHRNHPDFGNFGA